MRIRGVDWSKAGGGVRGDQDRPKTLQDGPKTGQDDLFYAESWFFKNSENPKDNQWFWLPKGFRKLLAVPDCSWLLLAASGCSLKTRYAISLSRASNSFFFGLLSVLSWLRFWGGFGVQVGAKIHQKTVQKRIKNDSRFWIDFEAILIRFLIFRFFEFLFFVFLCI